MLRKKYLLLLALLVLAFACEDTPTNYIYVEPNIKFDVVVIMGQSNTHQGKGYNAQYDTYKSRVVQFGRLDGNNYKVIPAVEPIDHHTKGPNRIGFSGTFSREYWKNNLEEDRYLLIIPCGKGSTGLISNHWNPGDELYEDAVARTNFVMAKNEDARLVAVLWHQGEQDVDNPNYEQDLDHMITSFRAEVNHPNVPFILGGMCPDWIDKFVEKRQPIQDIIQDTPNRLPFTNYADPLLPFRILTPEDEIIHYTAAGQREMGVRYYQAFEEIN